MSKKQTVLWATILMVAGIVITTVSFLQIPAVKATVMNQSFLERFGISGGFEQELKVGEFITVFDEKTNKIIDKISRVVYVGDEFIEEGNQQYRIVRVRGNKAYAKDIGKASDIVWQDAWDTVPVTNSNSELSKKKIAIYHTHSDESYVPTDGSESIPAKGGIFKVGSALAGELEARKVTVLDDKTPHEPHDANAYLRSRRTAAKLMKSKPIAILDVHRDGVPDPEFYNKRFEGEPITKVRLVVGRQNPKMATNLAFAKNIKAYMDKHKPGLIKGIFIGRGAYNQDLSSRALLLEVGTHTSSRIRAERGASVFADALPAILNIQTGNLGVGGTTGIKGAPGESRNSWSTLGWIVGIVLFGGAVFLFISTGSVAGMKSKVSEMSKTEFGGLMGQKKIGNKDREKK